MKTASRMILRYILAAFSMVLVVMVVNFTLFAAVVLYFGAQEHEQGFFSIRTFAGSFSSRDGGLAPDPQLQWQEHFAWAMLLDEQGQILWSQQLPQELNHPYTVPEVASFSRWYLDDYPVMVYRNDYGLLVAGKPQDSITRFDFYMDNAILDVLLKGIGPVLVLDLALVLAVCLLLGWRGARPLRQLARAIGDLARGEPVQLPQSGATAELAQMLNQTSCQLQRQSQLIQQRDLTRANWIAGVSHDIRTPLALILGYAEQLARQAPQSSDAHRRAAAICTQCQKIKALIEDLNLTFKLQYNAQPLRRETMTLGPWLRRTAAAFLDALEEESGFALDIQKDAGQSVLQADAALLTRALDNLLNNARRHNPPGCQICVTARRAGQQLCLTVRDNGEGYPQAVLDNLGDTRQDNAPHILGLYLVQQIAQAHGGRAAFFNDGGAVAQLWLPAADATNAPQIP